MKKATAIETAGERVPNEREPYNAGERQARATGGQQMSHAREPTASRRQASNTQGHEARTAHGGRQANGTNVAEEHGGRQTGPPGQEAYGAIERELGVLLRRARALSAEMGRAVHPDVDSEAYGLLVGIQDYGRARASQLAGHLGLGKATISRQLKVLAQLGLIDREPDPADGRAFVLVLTDKGRQRLENTRTARRERFRVLLGTWPVDDVRLTAEMLARFNLLIETGSVA